MDLGWGAAKRSCRCYLCVGSAATARCEQQPASQARCRRSHPAAAGASGGGTSAAAAALVGSGAALLSAPLLLADLRHPLVEAALVGLAAGLHSALLIANLRGAGGRGSSKRA